VSLGGQLDKICYRIAFPIVLNVTPYAVDRRISHQYGVVGVISDLGRSSEDKVCGFDLTTLKSTLWINR
jgi:hypothetical protein